MVEKKKKIHTPPFTITAETVNLVAEISALLERFAIRLEQADGPMLRKVNRMKTIRGSLAIEGNSLSEEQVTALIEGKHVIAPIKEIQEVRNAILAYEEFPNLDPFSVKDLLKAHGIMALGLVDNPGHFRRGGVGVMGRSGISHVAPPAHMVSGLISDLFEWLKNAEDHILIKSSVFHYEFEFIHPFEDGNGRMGRFWQSRLLSEWNPVFAHLPIENMIWENQAGYYKAIEQSTDDADSGVFVEFMLKMIANAIKRHRFADRTTSDVGANVGANVGVNVSASEIKILDFIKENPEISAKTAALRLNISQRQAERIFSSLKEKGLIKRIGADKNGHWEILD